MSNNKVKKKKKTGPLLPVLIAAAVLLLSGTALVWFGMTSRTPVILPNITIGEVPVGGLTREEALEALADAGWQERTRQTVTLTSYGGITAEADPVRAGVILDAETAVEAAWNTGRSGNPFRDLVTYIRCSRSSLDVNALVQPDMAYLQQLVSDLADRVDALFADDAWTIDAEQCRLSIYKAQGTLALDTGNLPEQILAALRQGIRELTVTALNGETVRPDFQGIYDSVCAEMADACYATDGSRTILPEQVGYRFDIAMAEGLWESALPGQQVFIPLEIAQPSVTAEMLEQLKYHDLLGAVTTKYNNSGSNRCSNVRLAASKIDGIEIYPGEEFSFNETVGVRTAEEGFLPAPAYAGYENIQEEIGGGVCQVSTGVYASALFADLTITAHTCHIYPPNYIQMGTDATVTIPAGGGRSIDLKFVNSKSCPIRIVAYCEETERNGYPYKTITVELWGTLEEDDFMPVEFDNSYTNIFDYDRVVEPSYPDREGYKLKFTHEETEFEDDYGKGIRTLTHRKVYDSAGNLVQDRIVNRTYSAGYMMDTYYYMNQNREEAPAG